MHLTCYPERNPSYGTPVLGTDVNSSSLILSKTTDYVGNKFYEGGVLKKIFFSNGYYDNSGKKYYFYVYNYLGNICGLVQENGGIYQKTHYYPFGLPFELSSGQEVHPLKYNGKELDMLHGLNQYDYGARYYEPSYGRFTTMDPLAEKYYSISPYAYCLNNPLRYTDPTGKWVVGKDGKPVTYSTEKGWSKNTTKDVKRIGNAMMKTETGTSQLNKLFEHSSEISMSVSHKVVKAENGSILFGNTELSGAKIENGKLSVEKMSITIYDKSIDKDIKEGGVDYNGLTLDEAIGAVGTHESGHTDDRNVKQLFSNAIEGTNFDTEAMPMELEKKYIEELKK